MPAIKVKPCVVTLYAVSFGRICPLPFLQGTQSSVAGSTELISGIRERPNATKNSQFMSDYGLNGGLLRRESCLFLEAPGTVNYISVIFMKFINLNQLAW